MAQRVKALAAKHDNDNDLSLSPGTHMVEEEQQCSYFTDENKFKERLRKSYMPPHNIQQKIW